MHRSVSGTGGFLQSVVAHAAACSSAADAASSENADMVEQLGRPT